MVLRKINTLLVQHGYSTWSHAAKIPSLNKYTGFYIIHPPLYN